MQQVKNQAAQQANAQRASQLAQAAAAAALDDDIKPKREEVEFDWAAIPDFDSDAFGCPSDSMLPIKQEEALQSYCSTTYKNY